MSLKYQAECSQFKRAFLSDNVIEIPKVAPTIAKRTSHSFYVSANPMNIILLSGHL